MIKLIVARRYEKKKKLAPTKKYIFAWSYNRNLFFFFFWDSYSLFFIQGVFKSHLKKNHPHLKCQFPVKIPIWRKSLPYKPSEKLFNSQFSSGRVRTMNFTIFNSSLMKHLRWSSLCKLANRWRLLNVVTKSVILKVTGLPYPTRQRTDKFGVR